MTTVTEASSRRNTADRTAPGDDRIDVGRCQLCGCEASQLQFEDPPYRVLRCRDCGLVWISPRWHDDEIHHIYDAEYWRSESPKTKGYANYAEESKLYLKTFRLRTRLLRRYLRTNGRVLDVGCAAGFFLRVMRDSGHEVRGVEVSRPIAEEAIAHLGEDHIHIGKLESVPKEPERGFATGSFDLVTMWDVVEHVPDPQALLRQARLMLRPDGHLLIETQNVDSRFARLLGPKWHHYKHEEHIYHFNPRTVRALLDQAGFEVVKLTSAYGGKYVSFGFIAERAGRLNRFASVVLKPLNLLKSANMYLNFHDEMIVIAKPKRA